jgi:hypothetical protein
VTRFSETNQRTRRVLPPPLRIQIQKASIVREEQGSWLLTGSLETLASEADANSMRPYRMPGTFFVSTIDNPARLLRTSDTLVYGENYLFWIYDKTIKCRVYLERNARIGRRKLTPEREWDETGFYLGLSPTSKPSQHWEITGRSSGQAMEWESLVGLTVGGNNPDRRQPDSTERRCLSSSPVKPFWHSTFESIWDDSEQIQLVPQHHDPPPAPLAPLVRGELSIHAIPDIDEAGTYRLYSPESTRRGTIVYEGAAAIIPYRWSSGYTGPTCTFATPKSHSLFVSQSIDLIRLSTRVRLLH